MAMQGTKLPGSTAHEDMVRAVSSILKVYFCHRIVSLEQLLLCPPSSGPPFLSMSF